MAEQALTAAISQMTEQITILNAQAKVFLAFCRDSSIPHTHAFGIYERTMVEDLDQGLRRLAEAIETTDFGGNK